MVVCRALVFVCLVGAVVIACGAPPSSDPELILTGGLVYPLGSEDEPVTAVAIHGDSILALGSDAEIRSLAGPYTQEMSLEETAVLPGVHDTWVDLEALGRWELGDLDMRLASSVDEAQAMVRNAAGTGGDGWLVGWGWDENDWPDARLPDRAALDATGIERPIALVHRSGRAAWLNSVAVERLSGRLENREGVLRDPAGAPRGILLGEAVEVLHEEIEVEPARRREWLAGGARRAAAAGVTRASTAPLDLNALAALLELEFRGLLPLRVDARLTPAAAEAYADGNQPRRLDGSALVRVSAVGIRLDGPLAARFALLEEPYPGDAPSLPPLDRERLDAAAAAAEDAGLPLHVHAAGDAAVAAALQAGSGTADIVGFDLAPTGALDLSGRRIGIAAARFARDIYHLDRVLGPERAARAHAWAELAAAGATFTIASDAPAYRLRPLAAVAAAQTRQDAEGYPAGGWHPAQGLERASLLRALAGEAAGLEAGDPADLVAWSEDPVVGDAAALRRAEALLTIVDGRVAYSRALVDPSFEPERR